MQVKGALFVLALAVLAVGCKKSSPLVGTWTSETMILGRPALSEDTFEADGTCHSVTTLKSANSDAGLTATDKGTWKLEADQLTEKITDIDMKFSGPNPTLVEQANKTFADKKTELLTEANQHPTETIKWSGDDQFSYTREGTTYTFKRKK